MKDRVKEKVRKFMRKYDTKGLSTNQFIVSFIEWDTGGFDKSRFLAAPSVESISRARRWLVANEGFEREGRSMDEETVYKREFRKKAWWF